MQINDMNTEKSAKGDLAALVVNKNNDTKCRTGCRPSMVFWFLVSVLLMVALWLDLPRLVWRLEGAPPEPVLACYYTVPSARGDLQPEHIDPQLCTHINVAFAAVRDKQLELTPALRDALTRVVRLKRANPRLRVLLSVGGAGAGGFSEMVADHASRKVFIKSIKAVLRDYSLDGVDLDWEYPNVHETCNQSVPITSCLEDAEEVGGRQRQHFSQLLREIRAEYFRERRNYLLTVAVAAAEIIVNVAYDIDQLNLYTDFVNVMTYDYHFYSSVTPFTGFNSPLYAERDQQLYMATLNINYTVGMYLQRGLLREKLVLGVPTYGHSFRLVNENNGNPGAPASGVGQTGSGGFVDYATACALARGGARRADRPAVPYVQRGREWLSYDDVQSVERKAVFLCSMGLRGAMIFSLNTDDFRGSCAQGGPRPRFPLVGRLRRSLRDCRAHAPDY